MAPTQIKRIRTTAKGHDVVTKDVSVVTQGQVKCNKR